MTEYAYFASDGTFGSAEDIVIGVTSDWTEEDWQTVKDARPDERHLVAEEIFAAKKIDGGGKTVRHMKDYVQSDKAYVYDAPILSSNKPLNVYDRDELLDVTWSLSSIPAGDSDTAETHGYNGA